MKPITIFITLIFFVGATLAQGELPTISSNSQVIRYRIAGEEYGWRLDPSLKPDVLSVGLIDGKPTEVTFVTDVEAKVSLSRTAETMTSISSLVTSFATQGLSDSKPA